MSENLSDQNEIEEDFKSNEEQDVQMYKIQTYKEFFESREINVSSQQKLKQSVQKVVQLFKNDQKSSNTTIYDILAAYFNVVQSNNDPRIILHDMFVLRIISNDWINIRNTKYLNIMLLIIDFQLNNLCKNLNCFSCNKIAGALLFIQQVEIFAESKFIPGRIRFYNEFMNYLSEHKEKFNQFDEDTNYLLDDAKTIQNYDIFLFHLLQSLRLFIQNNKKNANIDLMIEPLQQKLQQARQDLFENIPEKTKDILEEIIDLVDDTIGLASYKETVYVIPDLPIIKIKPLTPRIKEEFLFEIRMVKKSDGDDIKKLKKKQKIMKKQLTRELISDQQVINGMKKNDKQRQIQLNAKAYKGFKHQMDEAQLELKKLKTQQIHHKRIKKQSRRVGGNKFKR